MRAVESLVDDEHTYRVAGIEEGAGGGVVRGADEVETGFLHLPYLTDLGGIEGHGTEHAVIVMHAGAIDEKRLVVEQEAFLGIERERADAEVNSVMSNYRAKVRVKLYNCFIQVWGVG